MAEIEIDTIGTETLVVPILGTMPLIMHNWSEKSKRQMLDNMQGKKTPKVPRDPKADYESAFYLLKGGSYGFPVTAFKAATVSAARFYGKDVSMTQLRQTLFMKGELGADGIQALVPIHGSEPRMREDYVRVGQGGTDLRYRPEFSEWSTELEVVYVRSALTRNSVMSLIDAGGFGVGVGEWRPERRGEFGTYRVDPSKDVRVKDAKTP
jgi:hypothetical protein